MRILSSFSHRDSIGVSQPDPMRLDDHVLPAAAHLTDGRAHEVLATAVRAAGGRCRSVRPRHVRYRPGHDLVVHFAAESHVDRSILGPEIFVQTNVMGTQVLLEIARRVKIARREQRQHVSAGTQMIVDDIHYHREATRPAYLDRTWV